MAALHGDEAGRIIRMIREFRKSASFEAGVDGLHIYRGTKRGRRPKTEHGWSIIH